MSLENFPGFLLNFSEREMNGEAQHFYQFKSFRLDVAERQLLKDGVPVPLTPKAFDVLTALVTCGGHLVEKEELLKTVWADSFVEEANVARIVHTLRKILGEDENGNKFIETVPTRGYRFVAEVKKEIVAEIKTENIAEVTEEIAPPVQTRTNEQQKSIAAIEIAEPAAPRTVQKISKKLLFAGFAVLTAAAIGVFFVLAWNGKTAPAAPKTLTVAVLPFNPVSGDNRDEANDLGLAMLLINQLNQSKALKVRGFSAIKSFTDAKQDAVAIGQKLRADYVVESNYVITGGRVLITSELHNVASGAVEETFSYEANPAERFASGDAIAAKIGRDLLAKLNLEPVNFTPKRGTANEEAFRIYMHGINLTDKRSRVDAENAVSDFEEAIRLDPNFAQAWAGLGYAHNTVKVNGGDVAVHCEKARTAAQQALGLDSNLADAYSLLGMNQHSCQWNHAAAEISLRKAVELAPNSAFAHRHYGIFLTNIGRAEDSIREIKTAIDLDPTSLFSQKLLGRALFFGRRYDEAIVQLKKTRELDANDPEQTGFIGSAYEMKGDFDSALEWFLTVEKINNGAAAETASWRKIYAESGWQGVLRKRLEIAEQKAGDKNVGEIATLAARLGEKEKAFDYLEKELPLSRLFAAQVLVEPALDSLRTDARFADSLKLLGRF